MRSSETSALCGSWEKMTDLQPPEYLRQYYLLGHMSQPGGIHVVDMY